VEILGGKQLRNPDDFLLANPFGEMGIYLGRDYADAGASLEQAGDFRNRQGTPTDDDDLAAVEFEEYGKEGHFLVLHQICYLIKSKERGPA
jgi:hypothetical protein